jgi:hypothetical protein
MGLGGDQSFVPVMDSGQVRLKELGYKQELKRDLSSVSATLSFFFFDLC